MAIDTAWLESEILNRSVSDDERALLASTMKEASFKTGEKIITKGEQGGTLYLLYSGSASATDSDDSDKIISLAEFEAGSMFGEITFLNNHPTTANVVANEDSVVYTLARNDLTAIIKEKHQQLAYLILTTIMEHQSGIILKQRVTLAPSLRKLNEKAQGLPVFVQIILAIVIAAIALIIFL